MHMHAYILTPFFPLLQQTAARVPAHRLDCDIGQGIFTCAPISCPHIFQFHAVPLPCRQLREYQHVRPHPSIPEFRACPTFRSWNFWSMLCRQLREYQHIGLDWLVTLYQKRLNGGWHVTQNLTPLCSIFHCYDAIPG